MRGLLRDAGEVTGKQASGIGQHPDVGSRGGEAAAKNKESIRKALRVIAIHGKGNTLRASALIALGRVGNDTDAVTFVRILSDRRLASDVHEGAALGLGMLETIESPEIKKATRAFLEYNLEQETFLSQRARAFGIFAAGLRARDDDAMLMSLLGRCTKRVRSSDEGAHIAFACGLSGQPMATPELVRIAKTGTFHRQRLSDVGRSHVVIALGRAGDPYAVRTIAKILSSRSTPLQTRRACALALGRWLRTGISDNLIKDAKRPLLRSLEKSSDPLLRGFCALALAGAKEPLAIPRLMELVDRGGAPALRPFAALALGLAARNAEREMHEKIGRFLLKEMEKTKEVELASALSLSLGLARATDATEALLERVNHKRLNAKAKGAAIQALGIMGRGNPKVDKALFDVLKEGHRDLVGDAALALGLLGRRSTVPVLLKMLEKGGSDRMIERTILALGHLGSPSSVKPLIEIAGDPARTTIVREFACVALGLLGDDREADLLFELDADFNYFATTVATNELIRLY